MKCDSSLINLMNKLSITESQLTTHNSLTDLLTS
jgi:hypothetical protein